MCLIVLACTVFKKSVKLRVSICETKQNTQRLSVAEKNVAGCDAECRLGIEISMIKISFHKVSTYPITINPYGTLEQFFKKTGIAKGKFFCPGIGY